VAPVLSQHALLESVAGTQLQGRYCSDMPLSHDVLFDIYGTRRAWTAAVIAVVLST